MHEIFFAVGGHRSSVISLFRHRDGPVKKNQIFAVFQKQAIFPKFKIFRQNECTRFFSPSSVVAVVGRSSFPSVVTGTDLWKKIKFSPFFKNKQSFQNSKFLGQNECPRFFVLLSVVGHPSFPSFVTGTDLWKKIKFSPFFKNKQSFQNSRFLGKMSARDFFAVVGRRSRRSSVISLCRHRDGPVKKNQMFAVFQKQAIFPKFKIFRQNECTRFFSLLSVVGHPSFPSFVTGTDLWKKIKFSPFFKNK